MKNSLQIKNLHASTRDGKEILNGVSLTVKKGEIHVLMGPNGGGKSTFAQVLAGHPTYTLTEGSIILDNQDITSLPPDQKAKAGLFLGFQYPVEVAGVNYANFLRMAINEKNELGKRKISPIAFRKMLSEKAEGLGLKEITKRSLNEGFSGGEKKKAEILQMALLKPPYVVLDEPDSGLDVDALKYISHAINSMDYEFGLILITHYQRILKYIKPDFVHILVGGKIVKSGDHTLAEKVEKEGYEKYVNEKIKMKSEK